MSQQIFADINPNATSGTQLATYLNQFKAALLSGLIGPSRPPELLSGGTWIDNSAEIASDLWYIKLYNGITDIILFTINIDTGTLLIPGTDNSFEILKVSSDTAAAILKLSKRRASNTQVNAADVIGEIQFVGRDNASGNPVVARIKAVATDTMTASIQGAAMIFEQVFTGANTLTEVARFLDGKFGIGLIAPTADLHVRGANGAIVERFSDDSTAASISIKKQRATGNGGILSADNIASLLFRSADSTAGTIFTGVSLDAVAAENHTSAARGTTLSLKLIQATTTTLAEIMSFGSVIYTKIGLQVAALILDAQNIATTATIAALNADYAIANFTGSTATSVQGVSATGKSKVVLLYNQSSATVTVEHEHASASAANRITLPNSRSIALLAGQAVELFYNTATTKWTLKSGSGGGGGDIVVQTAATVTGGGTIPISQTDPQQVIKITGGSVPVTASTTPFGGSPGPTNPVAISMIGHDNDFPVSILYNDADYGCVGNFDDVEGIQITKDLPAKALWYPATKRYYVSRGV